MRSLPIKSYYKGIAICHVCGHSFTHKVPKSNWNGIVPCTNCPTIKTCRFLTKGYVDKPIKVKDLI